MFLVMCKDEMEEMAAKSAVWEAKRQSENVLIQILPKDRDENQWNSWKTNCSRFKAAEMCETHPVVHQIAGRYEMAGPAPKI
jgi:hypothetical protein